MNCRPGDLAYIVGAKFDAARHNGKIVRCVRLIDFDGPTWLIEPKLDHYWAVGDARLRPIRPGDISDEEVRDLYAPKVPEAA